MDGLALDRETTGVVWHKSFPLCATDYIGYHIRTGGGGGFLGTLVKWTITFPTKIGLPALTELALATFYEGLQLLVHAQEL